MIQKSREMTAFFVMFCLQLSDEEPDRSDRWQHCGDCGRRSAVCVCGDLLRGSLLLGLQEVSEEARPKADG